MCKISLVIFLMFMQAAHVGKEEYYTKYDDQYEVVDGNKELVGQTVNTFRRSDNNLAVKLVKVFNYKDDPRIYQLTGLKKENGLTNYTLDSIFYDKYSNDTLKVSYTFTGGKWQKSMSYTSRYGPNHVVLYSKMEKHSDPKFTNESYYRYNAAGKLVSETEYRCSVKSPCDSTYKKEYFYSPALKLDSTASYTWVNKKWQRDAPPVKKSPAKK